jgi:hypothetical protein
LPDRPGIKTAKIGRSEERFYKEDLSQEYELVFLINKNSLRVLPFFAVHFITTMDRIYTLRYNMPPSKRIYFLEEVSG